MFWIFRRWKIWSFLSQNVDGNMYLLITDKLFWTFRQREIRSFVEPKSWWKDDVYWLMKSYCFQLFTDRKCSLFFSQKVDGKMIFTWSFWAFHNIPGLRKYCISCSAQPDLNAQQYRWVTIKHSWYGLRKKRLEPYMKQTQFLSILSWVFTVRKVQRRIKEQYSMI